MRIVGVIVFGILWLIMMVEGTSGIRIPLVEGEECFSQHSLFSGDTIHVSFVVIPHYYSQWLKPDADHKDVTLKIEGPNGKNVAVLRDRSSELYEFTTKETGIYRFCFVSNSHPRHGDVIDFDLRVSHFPFYENKEKVKDEHFVPVMEQLNQLNRIITKILSEQHWLGAETDRQAIVNERMSRRAVLKSVIESAGLIGCSVLQVYLLQRLFQQRIV